MFIDSSWSHEWLSSFYSFIAQLFLRAVTCQETPENVCKYSALENSPPCFAVIEGPPPRHIFSKSGLFKPARKNQLSTALEAGP